MNLSAGSDEAKARWTEFFLTWMPHQEKVVRAVTFLRHFDTDTKPALLQCDDGETYIVKGQQVGRRIVNDHIVAKLGEALNAPVGQPVLVDVSSDLIEIEPQLSHFQAGIAHGSRFIPGCFDSYEVIAADQSDNRPRLSLLAVLYGWVQAYDQQFIYLSSYPQLIYSVDHSHVFPISADCSDWEESDLHMAPVAKLDAYFSVCDFSTNEIREALSNLEAVSEENIMAAVASPPVDWGLTIEERVALMEYLVRRRQDLLAINLLDD